MDNTERWIDYALDSLPVEPLPRGFTFRVISRISHSRPRFRLEFLDFAIPAFLAGFSWLAFLVLVWFYTRLDPVWLLRLQLEWEVLKLQAIALPNLPSLVMGGTAALGIGFGLLIALILWISENGWKAPVVARR